MNNSTPINFNQLSSLTTPEQAAALMQVYGLQQPPLNSAGASGNSSSSLLPSNDNVNSNSYEPPTPLNNSQPPNLQSITPLSLIQGLTQQNQSQYNSPGSVAPNHLLAAAANVGYPQAPHNTVQSQSQNSPQIDLNQIGQLLATIYGQQSSNASANSAMSSNNNNTGNSQNTLANQSNTLPNAANNSSLSGTPNLPMILQTMNLINNPSGLSALLALSQKSNDQFGNSSSLIGGAAAGTNFSNHSNNFNDHNGIRMNTCYVSNLPLNINHETLRIIFSPAGKIKINSKSGMPMIWIFKERRVATGDALVTFEDNASAQNAIKLLNNQDVTGQKIKVRLATNSERPVIAPPGGVKAASNTLVGGGGDGNGSGNGTITTNQIRSGNSALTIPGPSASSLAGSSVVVNPSTLLAGASNYLQSSGGGNTNIANLMTGNIGFQSNSGKSGGAIPPTSFLVGSEESANPAGRLAGVGGAGKAGGGTHILSSNISSAATNFSSQNATITSTTTIAGSSASLLPGNGGVVAASANTTGIPATIGNTRSIDWQCPECSNNNFSWRQTCNRCQTRKPESSSSSGPIRSAKNSSGVRANPY